MPLISPIGLGNMHEALFNPAPKQANKPTYLPLSLPESQALHKHLFVTRRRASPGGSLREPGATHSSWLRYRDRVEVGEQEERKL